MSGCGEVRVQGLLVSVAGDEGGRVLSQRRERSQVWRNVSAAGVRGGRGRVIVDIV